MNVYEIQVGPGLKYGDYLDVTVTLTAPDRDTALVIAGMVAITIGRDGKRKLDISTDMGPFAEIGVPSIKVIEPSV
jgi:hypothetical protein